MDIDVKNTFNFATRGKVTLVFSHTFDELENNQDGSPALRDITINPGEEIIISAVPEVPQDVGEYYACFYFPSYDNLTISNLSGNAWKISHSIGEGNPITGSGNATIGDDNQ